MNKLIYKHEFEVNENHVGQRTFIITEFYDDGDGVFLTNQKIELRGMFN